MPAGSRDRWPEDYERGRPGWPSEVVDLPGLPPTATVLDLGAGTGKLTRLLVPAFGRVVAVEPADAMRRILGTLCPEAEALPGTGQEIPLADASVDAVFAAQAFHWFDDERAIAEIARVLRPFGGLVLMWNLPAGPWQPSTAAAEDLLTALSPRPDEVSYDPLDLGGPRYAPGEWPLPG
jgi:ubiquinone/menaquinone biosynthesis C-methylase UbiE